MEIQKTLQTREDYEAAIVELGYTNYRVETHWRGKERRHPKVFVNGLLLPDALRKIRSLLDDNKVIYHDGMLHDTLFLIAWRARKYYDK